MQLSENFSLEELTYSNTAIVKKIDNTPSKDIVENLSRLAKNILQPIRNKWGSSINVTSGYRSPKLNSAIGGAKTSQHMTGCAADIKAANGKQGDLFRMIKSMIESGELTVGQLIWEK